MSTCITHQQGNETLTIEQLDRKHSSAYYLFNTTEHWMSEADSAFDFMNAIKRTAEATNHRFVQSQIGGYIDGMVVPRLGDVTISLAQRLQKFRAEKLTPLNFLEITHKIFDFTSMLLYSCAFFCPSSNPYLKVASVTDVLCDSTNIPYYAMQFQKMNHKLDQCKDAPQVVIQAIQNKKHDSLIHLARTISSFVTTVFACFAMLCGVVLFPATILMTCALANSFFSILSYYHDHYWCLVHLKA